MSAHRYISVISAEALEACNKFLAVQGTDGENKTNYKNWPAVHDFMPPQPGLLTVQGKCTFRSPGSDLVIEEQQPQGLSPLVLVLTKTASLPKGPEPDVRAKVPVVYNALR